MATPELIASWARTEAFLLQAKAALPAEVTRRFASQIESFAEFLAHNELGLAFDTLLDVVDESEHGTATVIRPLLLAAENMGLASKRETLAMQLTKLD